MKIRLLLLLFTVTVFSFSNAQQQGTIPAEMFDLHYTIDGEGPAALVIGSAHYYPRAFSKNLRNHLKMVFLDHRGFAPSPGPQDTTAYALEKILDDTERARQQLDLGKIIVIGHSGHAFMALEYAKKYPENVSHIVLIGSAPSFDEAHTALIYRQWDESVDPVRKQLLKEQREALSDEDILQMPADMQFKAFYIRDGAIAWYDPAFDSSPLWENVILNPDMSGYMWGKVFAEIDITKGLASLEIPVFIGLGRYDYLVAPAYTWDPVRPYFRDVTIRVFEKSGHTPQYEQAEEFDAALLSWISER